MHCRGADCPKSAAGKKEEQREGGLVSRVAQAVGDGRAVGRWGGNAVGQVGALSMLGPGQGTPFGSGISCKPMNILKSLHSRCSPPAKPVAPPQETTHSKPCRGAYLTVSRRTVLTVAALAAPSCRSTKLRFTAT